MRLIILPLGLLIFSAFFAQGLMLSGESRSFSDSGYSGTQNDTGEESTLTVEGYDVSLGFDAEGGFLAYVLVVVTVGVVAGITVLGSGIKEFSVKVLYTTVALYGVWLLFSVIGIETLSSIPVFGWALWFILTVVYGLGVFQQVGSV